MTSLKRKFADQIHSYPGEALMGFSGKIREP